MMKNNQLIHYIFFLCICSSVWGDEVNIVENQKKVDQRIIDENFFRIMVQEFQIDTIFKGGSNLIYDCDRKHYACVDTDSYNKCIQMRDLNYSSRDNFYSCAPLKRFIGKEECVLFQYEVQERSPQRYFCYKRN